MFRYDFENTSIVQDCDECLVNSVQRHWEMLSLVGPKFFGWSSQDLPTYEQICERGGTHKAYAHFGESYTFLNEQMRFNPNFNARLPEIHGAKEALRKLAPGLLAYLTTRPKSLEKMTKKELSRARFPQREVIARPEHIPLEQTSAWKLEELERLVKKHKKTMVMVDDSLSMHNAIVAASHPMIHSILFKGPITPKHERALDWNQIVELFGREKKRLFWFI